MHRAKLLLALCLCAHCCFAATAKTGVQVVADEANRRVDITIDGHPFTSYLWPTALTKPVLYPIVDADGVTVTRGYPLAPRPGERVDHPHHAGLWFNYGNANGFDFWNNSDAIKPEDRGKMGVIEQTRIVSTRSGAKSGELVADSVWLTGAGQEILDEHARYVFAHQGTSRTIDLIITLKALDRVVFHDDKEGLLGLRVARWLESPDEKGGVFSDANANPATGVYLTSEGVKGDAAWGTRGRWCALTGHTGDHTVDLAIFDHPGNPGYPTYWHARGYGLFAANPLGRSIFDPKQPPFNFTLEKGASVTFRYRVLIETHAADPAELNKQADAFGAQLE
jgi:hypothetical protein